MSLVSNFYATNNSVLIFDGFDVLIQSRIFNNGSVWIAWFLQVASKGYYNTDS